MKHRCHPLTDPGLSMAEIFPAPEISGGNRRIEDMDYTSRPGNMDPAVVAPWEITGGVLPAPRQERRLMALLVADAAGFCRHMHEDEAGTINLLNRRKKIIAEQIHSHEGVIVDSCGDNLMAAFSSAVKAVACAVNIQRGIERENTRPPGKMQFRIGIHLGDVICQGPHLYGNTVNIAARLESISEPGGIRISRAVHEQVAHTLDLNYSDLGKRYVKNIPYPIGVFRVGDR